MSSTEPSIVRRVDLTSDCINVQRRRPVSQPMSTSPGFLKVHVVDSELWQLESFRRPSLLTIRIPPSFASDEVLKHRFHTRDRLLQWHKTYTTSSDAVQYLGSTFSFNDIYLIHRHKQNFLVVTQLIVSTYSNGTLYLIHRHKWRFFVLTQWIVSTYSNGMLYFIHRHKWCFLVVTQLIVSIYSNVTLYLINRHKWNWSNSSSVWLFISIICEESSPLSPSGCMDLDISLEKIRQSIILVSLLLFYKFPPENTQVICLIPDNRFHIRSRPSSCSNQNDSLITCYI